MPVFGQDHVDLADRLGPALICAHRHDLLRASRDLRHGIEPLFASRRFDKADSHLTSDSRLYFAAQIMES